VQAKNTIAALLLVAGASSWCCATRVPAGAIAWDQRQPIVAPPGPGIDGEVGYLRVETDTDLRLIGRETYYNVRRPFDIYSPDGSLIAADVDNDGGRSGEEPRAVPLPAGRYVVASVYGTTYRKVQVEVHAGTRTDVPERVLREAPRVFAR
jgi:hypothetical protein